MDKYYKLAQLIRLGAKDIAKSDIAKRYYMQAILEVPGYAAPVLEAEDDSGYRAIILGDVYKNKGYCYLYTENADEDGNFTYKCFPPVKVIAEWWHCSEDSVRNAIMQHGILGIAQRQPGKVNAGFVIPTGHFVRWYSCKYGI